MLRFVFAGMATVGGVVALFLASSGDLPAVWPHADKPAATVTAVATPPRQDLQQQRDALQAQLATLQAQLRDAGQGIEKLRNQADQQRQQLAQLQQQRSAEQAKLAQLQADEAAQQKATDTARQQAAAAQSAAEQAQREAATQQAAADKARQLAAQEQAAADKARQDATQEQAAIDKAHQDAAAQQAALEKMREQAAADQSRAAELVRRRAEQTAERSARTAADDKPVSDARHEPPVRTTANPAAAQPAATGHTAGPADQMGAADAVLARLRRGETQPYTPRQPASNPAPAHVAAAAPPAAPVPNDAETRRRLALARNAIAAGQLEQARELLEQAQLRLVFQPVSPDQSAPSGGSRAAADIGAALSMLGNGRGDLALRYVDRALGETGGAQQVSTAPQAFQRY